MSSKSQKPLTELCFFGATLLSAALLACALHYPFLKTSGFFWDAKIYALQALRNDYAAFIEPWRANGRPWIGEMYWFIAKHMGLPMGAAFKIVALACLSLSAAIWALILNKFLGFKKYEALLAALLLTALPAQQLIISFTTHIYFYGLLFWTLSVFLGLWAWKKKSWSLHLAALVASLGASISEGYLGACMTLPLIFLCAELLKTPRKNFKAELLNFLKRWPSLILYLLVPPLYFLFIQIYVKPYGAYAESRDLSFSLSEGYVIFLDYFKSPLRHSLFTKIKTERFLLMTLAASLFIPSVRKKFKTEWPFLALTALISIATLFPYVLAQRSPSLQGWNLRHLMVISVPTALFFAWWLKNFSLGKSWIFYLSSVFFLLGISYTTFYQEIIWRSRSMQEEEARRLIANEKRLSDKSEVYIDLGRGSVFSEEIRVYEWAANYHFAKNVFPQKIHSAPAIEDLEIFENETKVLKAHALLSEQPKCDRRWKINFECKECEGPWVGLRGTFLDEKIKSELKLEPLGSCSRPLKRVKKSKSDEKDPQNPPTPSQDKQGDS